MTETAADLRAEIERLKHRSELTFAVCMENQSSVLSLTHQGAADALVEQHRVDALTYYEIFLDLNIHIGKLTRRLIDLSEA